MRLKAIVLAFTFALACSGSEKPGTADTTSRSVQSQAAAIPVIAEKPDSANAIKDKQAAIEARTPAVVALESFDFAKDLLDSAKVYTLSLDEARLLRGIVFGRHGRHFPDDHLIQAYLDGQSWYKADTAFANSRLNDVERDNLDIIRGSEAAHHDHIQPGDLRYHRGHPVTAAMLGHHPAIEWKMLASEVWAMNGHAFNDLPDPDDQFAPDSSESLQLYYNSRYWYKEVAPLSREQLSESDRVMVDSIDVARIRDLGSYVSFGMMRLFQTTPLSEKNLEPNDVMGLRLMRNEFYALHGRDFATPWLKKQMAAQGYQPTPNFKETDLSDVEKQNVELIRTVEERKHEELATRELTGREFQFMPLAFVRLLRNEIYARHGRVFRDKALQAYFSGMSWYKPDRSFDVSMLTAREKENARILLDHEKLIGSGGHYPEG